MSKSPTAGEYRVPTSHDSAKLETAVTFSRPSRLGAKTYARYKLRALSIDLSVDEQADRAFLWTANADSEDAATVFFFRVSTGELLWHMPSVPPGGGGSITLHPSKQLVEAGKPYGIPNAPYLILLT